ncbi:MAG TPA: lysylphosphatidylglycerol synthase transmembrane domain-containing protein [Fibrobacteria bacterium]|nr:lysylphosphatidylglycerol synthase transmembrane domain-containing protein [Fibrobacteria bacterium]
MERKVWLNALKIALTLAAALLLARKIDFHALGPLLQRCQWGFLLGCLLAQVATSLLVAWRWRLLWDLQGLPLRKYLYFVYLGYFFNAFLPSSATSEAIRVLAFGKKYGAVQESIGVNLMARGLGFILQMGLAGGSLWYYRDELRAMGLFQRASLNGFALGLALAGLSLVAVAAYRFRARLGRQKWLLEMDRIRKDKPLLAGALGLTALIQIASILGFWLLFMSLYPQVRLWQIVLFPAIIQVILMLPISFGGVGLREYLNLLFFSDIAGIPKDIIFALSVLGYAPNLFMALTGWTWMLFRRMRSE